MLLLLVGARSLLLEKCRVLCFIASKAVRMSRVIAMSCPYNHLAALFTASTTRSATSSGVYPTLEPYDLTHWNMVGGSLGITCLPHIRLYHCRYALIPATHRSLENRSASRVFGMPLKSTSVHWGGVCGRLGLR